MSYILSDTMHREIKVRVPWGYSSQQAEQMAEAYLVERGERRDWAIAGSEWYDNTKGDVITYWDHVSDGNGLRNPGVDDWLEADYEDRVSGGHDVD